MNFNERVPADCLRPENSAAPLNPKSPPKSGSAAGHGVSTLLGQCRDTRGGTGVTSRGMAAGDECQRCPSVLQRGHRRSSSPASVSPLGRGLSGTGIWGHECGVEMAEPRGLGAGELGHSLISGRRLRGAVAVPCLLRIKCSEQAGRDGGAVTPLLPRHAGTASPADVTRGGHGDRGIHGGYGDHGSEGTWGQQEIQGPWGVCGDSPGCHSPPCSGCPHPLGTLFIWGPPSPGNHRALGIAIPREAGSHCCPRSEQHRALRAAGPWGPLLPCAPRV